MDEEEEEGLSSQKDHGEDDEPPHQPPHQLLHQPPHQPPHQPFSKTVRTQRTRKALAQARGMYLTTAAPPFSKTVPTTGTSVQQLCFAIVLDTHKKRREKT